MIRSSLRRLALCSGMGAPAKLKMAVLPLALAAVAALPAAAQLAGKGAINGRIVDQSGAVIPDAEVIITNKATATHQTVKSTGAGAYSFSLDPGKYSLTVTHAGFKSFTQENIQVDALQTFSVDATLPTGEATESVTVTDAPPVLETSNASLGVTIENEQYSALPLIEDGGGQRRATDFAQYLPGVSAQTTNGNSTTNAGIVNGGGSRGAVSSIYISGVPITSAAGEGDPRFVWTAFPVESINQFQVQTVGYSAIYEGQGVQNYDVKKGGNSLHGALYDYYRDTGLDTWGFQKTTNPLTGLPQKPSEHQHNYGLFAGFPIIKDKLFVFGGYEGYRFRRQTPYQLMTIPTLRMRQGDFGELLTSKTACTAATVIAGCIYDPDTTTYDGKAYHRQPFAGNMIPLARQSAAAQKLQSYLPQPINNNLTNNYLVNYRTGLSNWSTANRIDYTINSRQTINAILSWGRQASAGPSAVSINSSSNNGAPPPYISSQAFAPKTKVFLLEHDFTISNSMVNQLKYGYGRYDGPGYSVDEGGTFGATANGIQGLPLGQAQDSFPQVTFTGNTNINRWAGYSTNRPVATGYVVVDNLQWNVGKHSFTFGTEVAWMQYNYTVNATGVSPLQLTFNSSSTSGYSGSTTTNSATGQGYASFLIGATQNGTFTQSVVPETGARFRPVSPYVQDNWKVTPNLTLDLGIRYDFYPSYREVKDRFAYFDPNATNPLIGAKGAVAFGGNGNGLGSGSGFCNCSSPVNNYHKGFEPRIGFAYTPNPTTVVRGSWGVVYTHGNANGGSAISRQGTGLEGYSVTPSTSFNNPTVGQVGNQYWKLDSPYPSYTLPPNFNPSIGTYYTSLSNQSLQNPVYADPYYGGRAPQFINYSFGIQQQFGASTTFTLSYVGSQGHFLTPDSLNGRGYYNNQLDPKYLSLTTLLGNQATPANRAAAGNLPLPYASFGGSANPTISQLLKPFPQYGSISDTYGFVGNSRYQALQAYMSKRLTNGLTFLANYTWSHSIDNNGTFRSGYDIPAYAATDGRAHAARSLDKSNSLGDQRHKFNLTGAYDLPFGKGVLGGKNEITRGAFGGFRLSGIFTAYSGQPLSIVQNSASTNPAANVSYPTLNPNYVGTGRIAGLSHPHTQAELGSVQYLDPNAFVRTPDYIFATTARTAAYKGLYQPGNYRLDLSLRRTIDVPTHGLHEGTKLVLEADYFNVTNHTRFVFSQSNGVLNTWAPAGTTQGNAYGTMVVDTTVPFNRALQLAGRIEF
ncbi:carboxypeptidase regulatory-like domain-containing protein [Terriglobus sp.]|uniref:carboxypeptidase regulatory-like domain-containing protein n=1 Tax=Terriglobus sp. TaxID=1889013 RepID=UPI003B001D0F